MEEHIKNARRVTDLLENKYSILGFRFGIEPILGLLPGLGDTLTFLLSFYLIYIAYLIKVPNNLLIKMLFYVVVDYVIGLIPIAGDFGDFLFRANIKNLKILEEYYYGKIQKST